MKLYLISQDCNNKYDTYDSAVVCAETEDSARLTHPDGSDDWDGKTELYGTWCALKDVDVIEIGLAHPRAGIGVVCASFNAG